MKRTRESNKQRLIAGGSVVLAVIILIVGTYMYVGKAGLMRFRKNWDSKMGDGITRELIIFDGEGDELLTRKGKFDFIYDGNHIEYIDTKTGLKLNIFAGNRTVVTINELAETEE